MKSPNKPDVLEEILKNLGTEIIFTVGMSGNKGWMFGQDSVELREKAKREILNWHKSQVKELVEEIKPEKREKYSDNAEKNYNFGYNHALDDFSKALIDKLGED